MAVRKCRFSILSDSAAIKRKVRQCAFICAFKIVLILPGTARGGGHGDELNLKCEVGALLEVILMKTQGFLEMMILVYGESPVDGGVRIMKREERGE